MSRILVTGGCGFIGSNLVDDLVEKDHEVVVIDDLSTGNLNNLNPVVNFVNSNVNEGIHSLGDFDYIFHYSACVGVKRTTDNPFRVFSDIDGIENVLEYAISHKVKRVFYSSSSEVYGEPVQMPQNEEFTPLNARLPYAVVKNMGEVYLKAYNKMHGLNYTIFRFFNTYGPRQKRDFVVSKFIHSALRGEDITIYGSGLQTRSFFYVKDNVKATTNALECEDSINQIINIGGSKEITIVDLAEQIIVQTNSSSKIVYLPPLKEGDMLRRCPDTSKMESLLFTDPPTNFLEGLERTIEYEKTN
jgi:nucleoside-diphosphate-sugar epimerase